MRMKRMSESRPIIIVLTSMRRSSIRYAVSLGSRAHEDAARWKTLWNFIRICSAHFTHGPLRVAQRYIRTGQYGFSTITHEGACRRSAES